MSIDPRALESAANVFMSHLPNNNRPTLPSDRAAAENIVRAYLDAVRWLRESAEAGEWLGPIQGCPRCAHNHRATGSCPDCMEAP